MLFNKACDNSSVKQTRKTQTNDESIMYAKTAHFSIT